MDTDYYLSLIRNRNETIELLGRALQEKKTPCIDWMVEFFDQTSARAYVRVMGVKTFDEVVEIAIEKSTLNTDNWDVFQCGPYVPGAVPNFQTVFLGADSALSDWFDEGTGSHVSSEEAFLAGFAAGMEAVIEGLR